MPVTFQMLLTLVSSSNAENAETLWGFIGRYRPGVTAETHPKLNAQVEYAIHYFRDFVQPAKKFRQPTDQERAALTDLRDALANLPADATAEAIQDVVYEIGRREPFLDEKKKAKDGKPGVSLDWFNMLYQVLLGQEKGPRFGSFVGVYGLQNTVDMIDGALARSRRKKCPAFAGHWILRTRSADQLNVSTVPSSAIRPSSTVSLGCFSATCFLNSINAALCVSVSIVLVRHLLGAIGDLGRAAVAVIHRDHFRDVMQLDRGGEIVPERRRPGLERGRDHADGSAGKTELAVFAGHVAAFHVLDRRLGKARIDAGQQHRVVIAFGAEGERGKCRHQSGARRQLQKSPPVEAAAQHIAAASACGRMKNGLLRHECPRV